jgi:hypothetical protein
MDDLHDRSFREKTKTFERSYNKEIEESVAEDSMT